MEIITGNISIKKILKDNRKLFCKENGHLIREFSYETINKVINCGSKELGFATFKCDDCGESKHIPFTCKSRFCNSCGKPQSDLRLNKLLSRWPKGLQYYHLAFTIPEELRPFFKRHRNALKILPQVASQTMTYFFKTKHKSKPGILSVIHSFGAKLNRNPHVHLIVTAGGIHDSGVYKNVTFIPYKAILPSRKYYLIKQLKKWCDDNLNNPIYEKQLLNHLYNQRNDSGDKKSRYIYFSKKANSFDVVLNYIGRYLKRPTISQSRILHYDGKSVTFSYKDKYDNKVKTITTSATDFIGLLIQHLPNKHFHMIYYNGIFANRCKAKYLMTINLHFNNPINTYKIPTTFVQRSFYFTGKNPLACNCGGYFQLYSITFAGYPTKYFDSG